MSYGTEFDIPNDYTNTGLSTSMILTASIMGRLNISGSEYRYAVENANAVRSRYSFLITDELWVSFLNSCDQSFNFKFIALCRVSWYIE